MLSANHSPTPSKALSRIWILTLCAVLATALSACGHAVSAQSIAPASQADRGSQGAGPDARPAAVIKLSDPSATVLPSTTPTQTATETPEPTETT